jgi:hypothetical protein
MEVMRKNMLINLTLEEIKEITGRVKATAQIRWLRQHGFTVLPRADGRPLVSRAHFEAKMGGGLSLTKPQVFEPDYRTLR